MRDPIFNLPIHTIEQARAVFAVLREHIDVGPVVDPREPYVDRRDDEGWTGICAAAAHLGAFLDGADT